MSTFVPTGKKVKVILLAGGLGTRISEETSDKPKPMVLIGNKPILLLIMKIFAKQGYCDFVIAAGYKKEIIEKWKNENNELFTNEKWNIEIVDTGNTSQTGSRIKQILNKYPNERFLITYGDGLANVNISKLVDFHRLSKRTATVTAVRPPARFGLLEIEGDRATHFGEKIQTESGWVNGGFLVVEPKVVEFISDQDEPFETGALPRLTASSELSAYKHFGFWKPMDTLREKNELVEMIENTQNRIPPWLEIE
jgi:glucose-1-phosphate cytidylyltransferase